MTLTLDLKAEAAVGAAADVAESNIVNVDVVIDSVAADVVASPWLLSVAVVVELADVTLPVEAVGVWVAPASVAKSVCTDEVAVLIVGLFVVISRVGSFVGSAGLALVMSAPSSFMVVTSADAGCVVVVVFEVLLQGRKA